MWEWKTTEINRLADLAKHFSPAECAWLLNRSKKQVYEKMRANNIPLIHPSTCKRRFYADNVAALFELREAGFSFKDLATLFRSSESSIRRVINRAKTEGMAAYPARKIC